MRDFKGQSFGDRLRNAAQAKQAMIRRAEKPSADDPDVIKRQEERRAIVAAREIRAEAKAKAAQELAERQAAELAEREAREKREARELADREVALAAEQKALRDARYAARKKRKA